MKLLLGVFFCFVSFQSFAADSCGPTELYMEKIALPNGEVLFKNPGIYRDNLKYSFICSEGNCLNYNVDEICQKHLGMSAGVSLNQNRCSEYYCPVTFLRNGSYAFRTGYYDIVSEIVCK